MSNKFDKLRSELNDYSLAPSDLKASAIEDPLKVSGLLLTARGNTPVNVAIRASSTSKVDAPNLFTNVNPSTTIVEPNSELQFTLNRTFDAGLRFSARASTGNVIDPAPSHWTDKDKHIVELVENPYVNPMTQFVLGNIVSDLATIVDPYVFVDWGDGSSDYFPVDADFKHIFHHKHSVADVEISFDSNVQFSSVYTNMQPKVIHRWDGFLSNELLFRNMSLCTSYPAALPPNLTSLRYMFYGATGITVDWDCSKIEDISGTFQFSSNIVITTPNFPALKRGYYAFRSCTTPYATNTWNTPNLTDLRAFFYEYPAAGTPPVVTAPIIDIQQMFSEFGGTVPTLNYDTSLCQSFYKTFFYANIVGDLSTLNTSSVKTFEYCFGYSNFSGNVNTWDVSKARNMEYMFAGCEAFNSLLTSWNTVSLVRMINMFDGCTIFNQPVNHFNVSKVTNLNSVFYGCGAFNQSLNLWDVSKVTDMGMLFYNCIAFNGDISTWTTTSLLIVDRMFAYARNFNSPIGAWDVSKVADFNELFYSCVSFNQSLNGWVTTALTNTTRTFYGCSAFDSPIDLWNMSGVTNCDSMFYDCIAFNQPLDAWVVSVSTSFYNMFYNCRLFNRPLTNWNPLLVTTTSGMFEDCFAFNGDLSTWTLPSLTSIAGMFAGCSAFNGNVNGFDVSKVTNFYRTFNNCSSFNQPLNNWVMTSATNCGYMFHGCTVFNQLIGEWRLEKVTNVEYMFWLADAFDVDLKYWCVPLVYQNANFIRGSYLAAKMPVWGTCPVKPLEVLDFIEGITGIGTIPVNLTVARVEARNSDGQTYRVLEPVADVVTTTENEYVRIYIKADVTAPDFTDMLQSINTWPTGAYQSMRLGGKYLTSVGTGYPNVVVHDSMFENSPLLVGAIGGNQTVVKSAKRMFKNCTGLNGNWSTGDWTGVTDAEEMFMGCTSLINGIDYIKVKNARNMYNGCISLTGGFSNFLNWALEDAHGMFKGCVKLAPWTFSGINVSLCTDMSSMFEGCVLFNDNVGGWTLNNNTVLDRMFFGATAFKQNLNSWNVVNHLGRPAGFADGSAMLPADEPLWPSETVPVDPPPVDPPVDPVPEPEVPVIPEEEPEPPFVEPIIPEREPLPAITTAAMRVIPSGTTISVSPAPTRVALANGTVVTGKTNGTTALGIPKIDFAIPAGTAHVDVTPNPAVMMGLLTFENISEVVHWSNIKMGIISLGSKITKVPDRPPLVDSFSYFFMFSSLFNQNLNNWDMRGYKSFDGMFSGATAYNQPMNLWDMRDAVSVTSMFEDCTAFNGAIDGWYLKRCRAANKFLSGCAAFNQPMNNWVAPNLRECNYFLRDCTSFNQSMVGFPMRNVATAYNMFSGCSLFNGSVEGWNLKSLQRMDDGFNGCESLNNPSVATLKFPPGCILSNLFAYCTALDQNFDNFSMKGISAADGMFTGCTLLKGNFSAWDVSSVKYATSMFEGCSLLSFDITNWVTTQWTQCSNAFVGTGITGTTTNWCVPNLMAGLDGAPFGTMAPANQIPVAGTCPTGIDYAFKYSSASKGADVVVRGTSVPANFATTEATGTITKLEIGPMATSINENAFPDLQITHLYTGPEVTSLYGPATFGSPTIESAVTTLTFGPLMTYIGSDVFRYLNNLTGVITIPEMVSEYGTNCFAGVKKVTKIKVGLEARWISDGAFNIQHVDGTPVVIEILNPEPPEITNFAAVFGDTAIVQVARGYLATYLASPMWAGGAGRMTEIV